MSHDRATDAAPCQCDAWASTDSRLRLLTDHHENCPHARPPLEAALALIADLTRGLEAWASDEDGIHPDAFDAYRRAKALQGVFVSKGDPDLDNDPQPAQHPCQLIICRHLYPARLWHWSVIMPDGHCYATSGQAFDSVDAALDSAQILGVVFLDQAERDWSTRHPRYARAIAHKANS